MGYLDHYRKNSMFELTNCHRDISIYDPKQKKKTFWYSEKASGLNLSFVSIIGNSYTSDKIMNHVASACAVPHRIVYEDWGALEKEPVKTYWNLDYRCSGNQIWFEYYWDRERYVCKPDAPDACLFISMWYNIKINGQELNEYEIKELMTDPFRRIFGTDGQGRKLSVKD